MTAPENLSISEVVRHYTNSKGEPASYKIQQATVPVTVGGETRNVLVDRLWYGSPDRHSRYWHVVGAWVVVRFRTGKKDHITSPHVYWDDARKQWIVDVNFRNNRPCQAVRWATEDDKGSGWN